MNKFTDIKTMQEKLGNLPGDTQIKWKMNFPLVEGISRTDLTNASKWFVEWARSKNVLFTYTFKRNFKLKKFTFDNTVSVEFKGSLKDIGEVLLNYINVITSLKLVPSEDVPHIHSIETPEKKAAAPIEPYEECDGECSTCEEYDMPEDECPEYEN